MNLQSSSVLAERARKPNQQTAEGAIMNVETTELKTVEATKSETQQDLLELSFDDLDLIGGGNAIGHGY